MTVRVADLGETTAVLYAASRPGDATLILGHGAGAGQSLPWLVSLVPRARAQGPNGRMSTAEIRILAQYDP